jgi:acyl carrier protein
MDNRQKLLSSIAEVLNLDVSDVSEESSPDSLPSWDSLATINLISELEQVFAVEFDISEIADFRTVGIIKAILAEKGIQF